MEKAHGAPRSICFLVVLISIAISSCFAFGQNAAANCSGPTVVISRTSRPTGVLRADPNANDAATQQILTDVAQACSKLSSPTAVHQVHLKISDNNIIVTGTVPTEDDEQQIIAIIIANADGRTVFNRLEVVPLQMASRTRQ